MKPIKQTIFGPKGNCFSACIASILECSIDDIPELNAYEEGREWVPILNEWLSKKGLSYMESSIPTECIDDFFKNKDFYYIAIGPTERSFSILHAVVGRKGKIIFDPHPTDFGLIEEDNLVFGVFIHTGI